MAITLLSNGHHLPYEWQLLRTPVAVDDTALLTADLYHRSFAQIHASASPAWELANVAGISGMEVLFYGTAAVDKTAVVTLFHASTEYGPLGLLGDVTVTLGPGLSQDRSNAAPGWFNQDSVALDPQIRKAFDPSLDWLCCKTYTVGVNIDTALVGTGPNTSVGAVSAPGKLIVDLARVQPKYVGALFTSLGGGSGVASIGAVWRPLARRWHGGID